MVYEKSYMGINNDWDEVCQQQKKIWKQNLNCALRENKYLKTCCS